MLRKKTMKRRRKKKKIFKKKVCKFCIDRVYAIDYKETGRLVKFLTEKGKIIPRKVSGNCSKHQRHMAKAIKQARHIALLPYSA